MSVIVEVTKTYEDAQLKVRKERGELFRTTKARAQTLVNAGVAKVIFEDPIPAKREAVPQNDSGQRS